MSYGKVHADVAAFMRLTGVKKSFERQATFIISSTTRATSAPVRGIVVTSANVGERPR